MPVYNSAQYLKQAIDSVLNQSLHDIELICVDDGSTDSSVQIIQDYCYADKRVILVQQKNSYAGVARNNGLALACGEYVLFMDSDDYLADNALKLLYELVKDTHEDMCIFFHKEFDNITGKIVERPHFYRNKTKENETVITSFYEDPKHFIYNAVVPWNKIYRRDFLIKYSFAFSPLQCANDRSFYFATILKAKKIKIFNNYLLYYRVNNPTSVAGLGRLKNFDCHFRSFEEILNYTKDESPEVKNMVIDACMKDMFSFFRKANAKLKLTIWQKMTAYFQKYNFARSENKEIPHYFYWYDEYSAIRNVTIPEEQVIISLTSFPKRIPTIYLCVESLLMQSLQVEKVILWLARDQFPKLNEDLPETLLELQSERFEIHYCEDIRSYKKLIPTLREFPHTIIITVDDDVEYNLDMARTLYLSYKQFPHSVHAHRVTKMYVWSNDIKTIPGGEYYYSGAHCLNKLVGVGGVLYPPDCFYKDILKNDLFMKLAPTNDDQWFWCMANLNGYLVRSVKNKILKMNYIEGSQEVALTKINDQGENLFFIQLKNLMEAYPEWATMLHNAYPEQYSKAEYIGLLHEKLNSLRQQLNKIKVEFTLKAENLLGLPCSQENYFYYRNMRKKDYPRAIKNWALRVRGKEINFSNPASLTEKIQWLKIHQSTRLKAKLSDKYRVRKWIEKKIGKEYLIPILGVYKHFKDINFDKLPQKFALKCNHGSGWNIIVTDKNNLNLPQLQEKVEKWLRTNFAYSVGLELHYKYIKPRIIIEQYMENTNNNLNDYKFFCCNGKVEMIWVDTDRYTAHKRTMFDTNWHVLPFKYEHPIDEIIPEKPQNLEKMIELAETLSSGFNQVRVDFYLLNDGSIKFGEITFTSGSGMDRFIPQIFDRYYGEKIVLPLTKK